MSNWDALIQWFDSTGLFTPWFYILIPLFFGAAILANPLRYFYRHQLTKYFSEQSSWPPVRLHLILSTLILLLGSWCIAHWLLPYQFKSLLLPSADLVNRADDVWVILLWSAGIVLLVHLCPEVLIRSLFLFPTRVLLVVTKTSLKWRTGSSIWFKLSSNLINLDGFSNRRIGFVLERRLARRFHAQLKRSGSSLAISKILKQRFELSRLARLYEPECRSVSDRHVSRTELLWGRRVREWFIDPDREEDKEDNFRQEVIRARQDEYEIPGWAGTSADPFLDEECRWVALSMISRIRLDSPVSLQNDKEDWSGIDLILEQFKNHLGELSTGGTATLKDLIRALLGEVNGLPSSRISDERKLLIQRLRHLNSRPVSSLTLFRVLLTAWYFVQLKLYVDASKILGIALEVWDQEKVIHDPVHASLVVLADEVTQLRKSSSMDASATRRLEAWENSIGFATGPASVLHEEWGPIRDSLTFRKRNTGLLTGPAAWLLLSVGLFVGSIGMNYWTWPWAADFPSYRYTGPGQVDAAMVQLDAAFNPESQIIFGASSGNGLLEIDTGTFSIHYDKVNAGITGGVPSLHLEDVAWSPRGEVLALASDTGQVSSRDPSGTWNSLIMGGAVPGISAEDFIGAEKFPGNDRMLMLFREQGWVYYDPFLRSIRALELQPALENREEFVDFRLDGESSGLLLTRRGASGSLWRFSIKADGITRRSRPMDRSLGEPKQLFGDAGYPIIVTDRGALIQLGSEPDGDIVYCGGGSFPGFSPDLVDRIEHQPDSDFLWWIQSDGFMGRYELATRTWRSLQLDDYRPASVEPYCMPALLSSGNLILPRRGTGAWLLSPDVDTKIGLNKTEIPFFSNKILRSILPTSTPPKYSVIVQQQELKGSPTDWFTISSQEMFSTEDNLQKPIRRWQENPRLDSTQSPWIDSVLGDNEVLLVHEDGSTLLYDLRSRYCGPGPLRYMLPKGRKIRAMRRSKAATDLLVLDDSKLYRSMTPAIGEDPKIDREIANFWPRKASVQGFSSGNPERLFPAGPGGVLIYHGPGFPVDHYDRSTGFSRPFGEEPVNSIHRIGIDQLVGIRNTPSLSLSFTKGSNKALDYQVVDPDMSRGPIPGIGEVVVSRTDGSWLSIDSSLNEELLRPATNDQSQLGNEVTLALPFENDGEILLCDESGLLVYQPDHRKYKRVYEKSNLADWIHLGTTNGQAYIFSSSRKELISFKMSSSAPPGINVQEKIKSADLHEGFPVTLSLEGNLSKWDPQLKQPTELLPRRNPDLSTMNRYQDIAVLGDKILILGESMLIEYSPHTGAREVEYQGDKPLEIHTSGDVAILRTSSGSIMRAESQGRGGRVGQFSIVDLPQSTSCEEVRTMSSGKRFLLRLSDQSLLQMQPNGRLVVVAGGRGDQRGSGDAVRFSSDDRGMWVQESSSRWLRWDFSARKVVEAKDLPAGQFHGWLPIRNADGNPGKIRVWNRSGVFDLNPGANPVVHARGEFSDIGVVDGRELTGADEDGFWYSLPGKQVIGDRRQKRITTRSRNPEQVVPHGTGFLLRWRDRLGYWSANLLCGGIQDLRESGPDSPIFLINSDTALHLHSDVAKLYESSRADHNWRTAIREWSGVDQCDGEEGNYALKFTDGSVEASIGGNEPSQILSPRRSETVKRDFTDARAVPGNRDLLLLLDSSRRLLGHSASNHGAELMAESVDRLLPLGNFGLGLEANGALYRITPQGEKGPKIGGDGFQNVNPGVHATTSIAGIDSSSPWYGKVTKEAVRDQDCWSTTKIPLEGEITATAPGRGTGSSIWLASRSRAGNAKLAHYDIEQASWTNSMLSAAIKTEFETVLQIDLADDGSVRAVAGSNKSDYRLLFPDNARESLLSERAGPLLQNRTKDLIWIDGDGRLRSQVRRSLRIETLRKPEKVPSGDFDHLWSVSVDPRTRLHFFGNGDTQELIVCREGNGRPDLTKVQKGQLLAGAPTEMYSTDVGTILVQRSASTGSDRVILVRGKGKPEVYKHKGSYLGADEKHMYFSDGQSIRRVPFVPKSVFSKEILGTEESPDFDISHRWYHEDYEFSFGENNLAFRKVNRPRTNWVPIPTDLRLDRGTVPTVSFERGAPRAEEVPVWLSFQNRISVSLSGNGLAFESVGFHRFSPLELAGLLLESDGQSGEIPRYFVKQGPLEKKAQSIRESWFPTPLPLDPDDPNFVTGSISWHIRVPASDRPQPLPFDQLVLRRPLDVLENRGETGASTRFQKIQRAWFTTDRSLVVRFTGDSRAWQWNPSDGKWEPTIGPEKFELPFTSISRLPNPSGGLLDCSGDGRWILDLERHQYQREQFVGLGRGPGDDIFVRTRDGLWRDLKQNEVISDKEGPVTAHLLESWRFPDGGWDWTRDSGKSNLVVTNRNWEAGMQLTIPMRQSKNPGAFSFDQADEIVPVDDGAYVVAGNILWWWDAEEGTRSPLSITIERGSRLGWIEGGRNAALPAIFTGGGSARILKNHLIGDDARNPIRIERSGPTELSHEEVNVSIEPSGSRYRVHFELETERGLQQPVDFLGFHFEHEFIDQIEWVSGQLRLHDGSKKCSWLLRGNRLLPRKAISPSAPSPMPELVGLQKGPRFRWSGSDYRFEIDDVEGSPRSVNLHGGVFSIDLASHFSVRGNQMVAGNDQLVYRRDLQMPAKIEALPELPPTVKIDKMEFWKEEEVWIRGRGGNIYRWPGNGPRWIAMDQAGPFSIVRENSRQVGIRQQFEFKVNDEGRVAPFLAGKVLDFKPEKGNFSCFLLQETNERQTMEGSSQAGAMVAWHSEGGSIGIDPGRLDSIQFDVELQVWPDPLIPVGNSNFVVNKNYQLNQRTIKLESNSGLLPLRTGVIAGRLYCHDPVNFTTSGSTLLVNTKAGIITEVDRNSRLVPVVEPLFLNQSTGPSPSPIEFLATADGFALARKSNTGEIALIKDLMGSVDGRKSWGSSMKAVTERRSGQAGSFTWKAAGKKLNFQISCVNGEDVPVEVVAGKFSFDRPELIHPGVSSDLIVVQEAGLLRPYLETRGSPWMLLPLASASASGKVVPILEKVGGFAQLGRAWESKAGLFAVHETAKFQEGELVEATVDRFYTNSDQVDQFPYELFKDDSRFAVKWPDQFVGVVDNDSNEFTFRHDRINDVLNLKNEIILATDGGVTIRDLESSWVDYWVSGKPLESSFDVPRAMRLLRQSNGRWHCQLQEGDRGVWRDNEGNETIPTEEVITPQESVEIIRSLQAPLVKRRDVNDGVTVRSDTPAIPCFPLPWDGLDNVVRSGDQYLVISSGFHETHNGRDAYSFGPVHEDLSGPLRGFTDQNFVQSNCLLSSTGVWWQFNDPVMQVLNSPPDLTVSVPLLGDHFSSVDQDPWKPGVVLQDSSRNEPLRDIREDWSGNGFAWDEVKQAEYNDDLVVKIDQLGFEYIRHSSADGRLSAIQFDSDPGLGIDSTSQLFVGKTRVVNTIANQVDRININCIGNENFGFAPETLRWSHEKGTIHRTMVTWKDGGIIEQINGFNYYSDARVNLRGVPQGEWFSHGRFAWDDVLELSGDRLKSSYRLPQARSNSGEYIIDNGTNWEQEFSWKPGSRLSLDLEGHHIFGYAPEGEDKGQLLLNEKELDMAESTDRRFHFRSGNRLWVVDRDEIRWLRLEPRWLKRVYTSLDSND